MDRMRTVLSGSRPGLEGGVVERDLERPLNSLSLPCCVVLERECRVVGRRLRGSERPGMGECPEKGESVEKQV